MPRCLELKEANLYFLFLTHHLSEISVPLLAAFLFVSYQGFGVRDPLVINEFKYCFKFCE